MLGARVLSDQPLKGTNAGIFTNRMNERQCEDRTSRIVWRARPETTVSGGIGRLYRFTFTSTTYRP